MADEPINLLDIPLPEGENPANTNAIWPPLPPEDVGLPTPLRDNIEDVPDDPDEPVDPDDPIESDDLESDEQFESDVPIESDELLESDVPVELDDLVETDEPVESGEPERPNEPDDTDEPAEANNPDHPNGPVIFIGGPDNLLPSNGPRRRPVCGIPFTFMYEGDINDALAFQGPRFDNPDLVLGFDINRPEVALRLFEQARERHFDRRRRAWNRLGVGVRSSESPSTSSSSSSSSSDESDKGNDASGDSDQSNHASKKKDQPDKEDENEQNKIIEN